jgi:hypothetical protein
MSESKIADGMVANQSLRMCVGNATNLDTSNQRGVYALPALRRRVRAFHVRAVPMGHFKLPDR